jgi:hypothetical protein
VAGAGAAASTAAQVNADGRGFAQVKRHGVVLEHQNEIERAAARRHAARIAARMAARMAVRFSARRTGCRTECRTDRPAAKGVDLHCVFVGQRVIRAHAVRRAAC